MYGLRVIFVHSDATVNVPDVKNKQSDAALMPQGTSVTNLCDSQQVPDLVLVCVTTTPVTGYSPHAHGGWRSGAFNNLVGT